MSKFIKASQKPLSFLLLSALINLFMGCSYTAKTVSPETPIILGARAIVVIHSQDRSFILEQAYFKYPYLSGTLKPQKRKGDILRKGDEIHVYLISDKNLIVEGSTTQIPLTNIQKVEVYEIDIGRTLLLYTVGAALSTVIFFILVMLFKESCPFVYVHTGEEYTFIGEIYSGTIYPNLERHDYLPLQIPVSQEDEVEIRITNEVEEIQHTNLAELVVVDHDSNLRVYMDKYGIVHTVADPQPALSAVSLSGRPLTNEFTHKDSVDYTNIHDNLNDDLMDGVVLSFRKPANIDSGKLLIRGKNSFWLDFTLTSLAHDLGNRYVKWKQTQQQKTKEELIQLSLENGIPLKVSVEKQGQWEYMDYFNVVGPMAYKDDVLALDLKDVAGDTVRVKLEYGFLFWDLDYVAMDFSPDIPVSSQTILPVSAITQTGEDIVETLARDDSSYYVQPNIGDQVDLVYRVPKIPVGLKRSMFLHSKGYYEKIMNPSGRANLARLQQYRKPGGLIEYSRDQYKKYSLTQ
jgi:hypothetical protein